MYKAYIISITEEEETCTSYIFELYYFSFYPIDRKTFYHIV